jgi:hypothetical protein
MKSQSNRNIQFKEIQLQLSWCKLKSKSKLKIEGKDDEEWILLSSGDWNLEAGPDFLNAKIQINGKIYIGDIEIHKQSTDWISHKHSSNKLYNNVMLHVVNNHNITNENQKSQIPNIPTMILQPHLYAKSISESDKFPRDKCEKFFSLYTDETLYKLFNKAGEKKFINKTNIFLVEMESIGIDSAILKHIFDGCGYKQNREQFAELFKRVNLYKKLSKTEYEAVLWGESGLLPDPSAIQLPDQTKNYATNIWDIWWRLRKNPLPSIEWKKSSNRPSNTPERRIAALIILKNKLKNSESATLTTIAEKSQTPKELLKNLKLFFTCSHPLWNNYYSFISKANHPTNILGESRANDIITNTALPALNAFATIIKNNELYKKTKIAYATMPKAQDNRILKTASLKWFMPPSRQKNIFKNAISQQGAIYLYRGFCLQYCSECTKCPLNELINSL